MVNKSVVKMLVDYGLKVTPQRISILEVILTLDTHPTAENIVEYLRISHPNISMTTIYYNLNTFIKKGIINKVLTENEATRYDHVRKKHHHLYFRESDQIEDYYDEELNKLLNNYFKRKKIPNFSIENIKLQITGKSS